MALNNVTKFHKTLIKNVRVRERTSSGQTYVIMYVRTDGRTDRGNTYHNTLTLDIIMAGA